MNAWRNSLEAHAARHGRAAQRAAPLPVDLHADPDEEEAARANRTHVRSITRALGGKGLPYYPEARLRL